MTKRVVLMTIFSELMWVEDWQSNQNEAHLREESGNLEYRFRAITLNDERDHRVNL